MKCFCFLLAAALFAMPNGAVAQQPQTPAPAQGTASPPANKPASPSVAADSSPKPEATPIKTGAGIVNSERYIIGASDSLQVTVWKEPTLSGTIPVRPDGMISMVLVGDLPAAGLTPMALAGDITQRLKKYIQDPSVSVIVLGVNSQHIFMVGEVGHVGPVGMTAGMTPLQAIAAAGGLSPFAKKGKIYILRATGGQPQKIPFNYKQALKGDNKQDITLLPGDTIVVP